jgi:hydroxyacylglutathione hydrolase
MTHVQVFEFNPFAENTYVVYDESGECIIFDPGCYTPEERHMLQSFMEEKQLRVVRLINTHCHLDHIFGNNFVHKTWSLLPELHRAEMPVLKQYPAICMYYGVPAESSPMPERFIEAGDTVAFGHTRLEVMLTPGHSPGSLVVLLQRRRFRIIRRCTVYGRYRQNGFARRQFRYPFGKYP